MATNIPKCFISYSWDSSDHQVWVRDLASKLQGHGIETQLDQWDLKPGQDMMEFMEFSIQTSDFVLMACTPNFAMKANSRKGGVGYENSIITGEIFYSIGEKTKFIPLLIEGTPQESLPTFLKSKMYIDFRKDKLYDVQFEELVRHIFNAPKFPKPALGEKPDFTIGVNRKFPLKTENGKSITFLISDIPYKLQLPNWWDDITVNLSKEGFSSYSITEYIKKIYGADVGRVDNWQFALKTYALFYENTNSFPVFIAHCARTGGDFDLAVKIYTDLHSLVELLGHKKDWYRCYLAYCAGTVYQSNEQIGLSICWHKKAGMFNSHQDQAIRYYAEQSISALEELQK